MGCWLVVQSFSLVTLSGQQRGLHTSIVLQQGAKMEEQSSAACSENIVHDLRMNRGMNSYTCFITSTIRCYITLDSMRAAMGL